MSMVVSSAVGYDTPFIMSKSSSRIDFVLRRFQQCLATWKKSHCFVEPPGLQSKVRGGLPGSFIIIYLLARSLGNSG